MSQDVRCVLLAKIHEPSVLSCPRALAHVVGGGTSICVDARQNGRIGVSGGPTSLPTFR